MPRRRYLGSHPAAVTVASGPGGASGRGSWQLYGPHRRQNEPIKASPRPELPNGSGTTRAATASATTRITLRDHSLPAAREGARSGAHQLSADLASGERKRMHVRVQVSGQQVGGLIVGQHR